MAAPWLLQRNAGYIYIYSYNFTGSETIMIFTGASRHTSHHLAANATNVFHALQHILVNQFVLNFSMFVMDF